MTIAVQHSPLQFENIRAPEIDFCELSLPEIVQTSKYQEFLAILKKTPKTDLHAHLAGAVPMDLLQTLCEEKEFNDLSNFVKAIRNGVYYEEAFEAFPMIGRILNTNERIEMAAYSFCQSQAEDKVTNSELRTGLKNLKGEGLEEYLRAVIRGLERGQKDFGVNVKLVLSMRRDTSFEEAYQVFELASKYPEVTGFDISGISTQGNASGIFQALAKAKHESLRLLPFTLHIGEKKEETAKQQMDELEILQPARVGHAVHLCPGALEWIERNRTFIEVCISSALCVSMITKPGEHPGLNLLKGGHPGAICTDDQTLFGSASEELALAACLLGFSIEKMIELQEKAWTYSF